MKDTAVIATLAILAASAGAQVAGLSNAKEKLLKVHPKVQLEVRPFAPGQVRLLDSIFSQARDADWKYLVSLDPYRLLNRFYKHAGLPTKGEQYGGWETETISGHSLGHYMSACSEMYTVTGDPKLKEKVTILVDEMAKCQEAGKTGLVCGIPDIDKVFGEVAKGDIRSKGFDLNGCWVPWYTLHKEFAGLIDAYVLLGNKKALDVAKKMADYSIDITKNLTPELWQKMLACEHGGMNEAMANLYAITGEQKYLDLALKFHHDAVLVPLEKGEKRIAGLHGNTQIPKIIGSAREYEVTGDPKFKEAALCFWDQVVHDHSYVIGGHGFGEYFGPPDKLNARLGPNTCETCNTYNMLKLTQHLFTWSPSVEEGDFYERAMYNHILASQDHENGMMCYFVPLGMGLKKQFGDEENTFTCCHGTGMENHAKYGEGVYYHTDSSLYVNLFVPSVLDWSEKGVSVKLESKYPVDGHVRLTLGGKSGAFDLKVRCPGWAAGDVAFKVNGSAAGTGKPGTFMTISRTWQAGDTVEFDVPMALRTEAMPDNPDRVALLYGPTVLAGVWDKEMSDKKEVPVLLTEGLSVDKWLSRSTPSDLKFSSAHVVKPKDMTFMPFYAVQHERYSVYWDLFTPEKWAAKEEEYRADEAKRQDLERRTTDILSIGEMQPERDHNLQGEKTGAGDFNDRKWRQASDGGWFSFEMKVDAASVNDLVLTYWGSDGGNRRFDVLVDGVKVATQVLQNNTPGRFFDVIHELPLELTKGKSKVTIKLQSFASTTAGGLFGARMVRKAG